jgi:hypothetical protein
MSSGPDEFDRVRAEPDPLLRGQRATRLLTVYQQRATELSRLRKAAIEEAHHDRGMTYTDIAAALGVTKGRITQIRSTGPRAERAFFGVGPVSLAVPYRRRTTNRKRLVILAEDALTGDLLEELMTGLALTVTRCQIQPDQEDPPPGDTVVVCGPEPVPVATNLLAEDPVLGMVHDGRRWWIEHKPGGERLGSPADDDQPRDSDVAYLARHHDSDAVRVHIAGIHAIGSLGAAHYLAANLADLYAKTGGKSVSLIVRCQYRGLAITSTELAAGPYTW